MYCKVDSISHKLVYIAIAEDKWKNIRSDIVQSSIGKFRDMTEAIQELNYNNHSRLLMLKIRLLHFLLAFKDKCAPEQRNENFMIIDFDHDEAGWILKIKDASVYI